MEGEDGYAMRGGKIKWNEHLKKKNDSLSGYVAWMFDISYTV